MNFNELRLAEPIVRAVADKGYTTATPIQAQAIPVALQGRDILGCAQTGTGKTCAFALPILHRLSQNTPVDQPHLKNKKSKHTRNGGHGRPPRALVLCPTRELAMQIYESFVGYGRNLHLRHSVVFGGVSQGKQVRELRAGVDVLIATPGRLLDLINQGHIDLSKIETLVLDEADRMLDMGFINDIRKVIDMIPDQRQTLFFSATVSRDIRRLADAILFEPETIETAPESSTAELIAQRVYMVERQNKPVLLERILIEEDVGRVLVFTRTKHGADKLVKFLRHSDINAEAIHGNKTQNARTRTMRRFKSGATQVLVATDIASRGIDVDEITHVVNFDMPIDPETYVHRIGRTARAGASGIALSFCDYDEMGIYRAIERRAKIQIEVASNHTDLTYDAPPPSRRSPSKKHQGHRKSGSYNRFDKQRPGGSNSSNSGFSGKSKFGKKSTGKPGGKPGSKPSRKFGEKQGAKQGTKPGAKAASKPSRGNDGGFPGKSTNAKFSGRVKKSAISGSKSRPSHGKKAPSGKW
jgi:ATP-dependent RNA helicase RhlE